MIYIANDINDFVGIGQPALSKEFIDRESELKILLTDMKSRNNYNIAMLGYRRIGKTSILIKLQDTLNQESDIAVVYFDIKKNIGEPKLFLTRLQKEIFDVYSSKLDAKRRIGTKVSRLSLIPTQIIEALSSKKIQGINLELGPEGTLSPKLELGDNEREYSELFYKVFETAKALAEKSNLKFIIILDEFQDLTELKGYRGLNKIFDLFRSVIQERGKNVSYIISSSRVHLLKSILEIGKAALFLHFKELTVSEMDKTNSIKLFTKHTKGRKINADTKTAEEAFSLVGGNPFYLISLADGWNGEEDIAVTYERLLTSPTGTLKLYMEYILAEDLNIARGGPMLRSILRALSDTDSGHSYSELSRKLSVKITKLPFYLDQLGKADLVLKTEKGFAIRDRVLRKYLQIELADIA